MAWWLPVSAPSVIPRGALGSPRVMEGLLMTAAVAGRRSKALEKAIAEAEGRQHDNARH